uniref:Uncharacterized protein n=1 Tax=Siphoviridae sp. ctxjx4 TaxID=2826522 RepID=A0A8S5M2R0_9CAUD|nr:MAG TPA: Protein of unknown function (DUF1617) [Siphoviridae sp. ctxjx4]
MRIQKILAMEEAIKNLKSKNLPIKTAYRLLKLAEFVATESDNYRNLFRQILDEYAEKKEDGSFVFSEDGTNVILKKDHIKETNEKVSELNQLEVDVPYTFDLKEFENLEISLEDLAPFMDIIVDEDETPVE